MTEGAFRYYDFAEAIERDDSIASFETLGTENTSESKTVLCVALKTRSHTIENSASARSWNMLFEKF
jgi:hypothetical protein